MASSLLRPFHLVAALFFLPYSADADDEQLALSVLVEDSSRASIPGASVTLACDGQPVVRRLAGSDGTVIFSSLPGRSCVVTARADRFGEVNRSVTVDKEAAQLEIQLPPASERTEITVSASSPDIEEPVTAAQGTLSQKLIAQTPILNSATGFTDILTRTTPGV